ncbi:MAG: NADH-quinone oxidoreductase subunit A [Archaeoglobales archaeon]|nr:MAG: NADH-quinone oxidoreductase subunit A [Archaeoglobales archaeon]
MQEALVVILLLALCLIIDGAIVLLAKILPKYNPTFVKMQRFEAGNPPLATPKYVLPMQYAGFLIMFMAIEPILVLLLLFSAYPNVSSIALILLSIILVIPVVYVSYQYALDIAKLRRGAYE